MGDSGCRMGYSHCPTARIGEPEGPDRGKDDPEASRTCPEAQGRNMEGEGERKGEDF